MKRQYVIAFEKADTIPQVRCILAENAGQAKDYFHFTEPEARICGVREDSTDYAKRGCPMEEVPDNWQLIKKENPADTYSM